MEEYCPAVPYRKWSVPVQLAKRIESVSKALGYEKRGPRWKLLELLVEYAAEHKAIIRRR